MGIFDRGLTLLTLARRRRQRRTAVALLALAQVISGGRAAHAQASSPPPIAGAAADSAPVEVSVRGVRPDHDIGARELPASKLRDVPGTFGDPFQTILALPGVAPLASGLPYFYVRGAPPADTGYFVDGIPLPALFHVGPGPSVVHPALLERIEFFPSDPPARYGRFVGGIISAETKAPSPVARGEASLRLFDASAFVEAPLDSQTSAVAAGRYGYPNLLLSVFAPNLSLGYGDYTLRVSRNVSGGGAISVLALGAYDTERDSSQGLTPVDTLFHRLDLRYDRSWSGGSLRVATTLAYDRTTGPLSTGANQVATETSARLRIELRQRIAAAARVSAGADASAMLDDTGAAGMAVAPRQIAGAYAELEYRPAARVEMTAGIRADAYRSSRTSVGAMDPKIALRIRLTPRLIWTSAVGIAHQTPTFLLPVPGLRLDPSGGLQTAYEYSQGLQVRLPWAMRANLTGFYSAVRNMNDFVSDCGGFLLSCSVLSRVDGRTFGVEVLLERALSERLSGWLAYTLSRAERQDGASTFLSPFDRTHMLSAVLRYDFGGAVEAGVRGTYVSGRADIPTFSTPAPPITAGISAVPLLQHRLPPFYRIDLRASKRFGLGDGAWLSAIVEFFNATLDKEAVDFSCNAVTRVCTARQVGPIALPSIGLEGGF